MKKLLLLFALALALAACSKQAPTTTQTPATEAGSMKATNPEDNTSDLFGEEDTTTVTP